MNAIQPLQPGDIAPVIEFRYADGTLSNTSKLKGQPFVVYFYPKDNTPGCTKEACAFRDDQDAFKQAGVTIIGVSADSEKSHDKFREKFSLPFPLASDPEKSIIKEYGVLGEKSFMGKIFIGIHRISFFIGADGRVVKTYPKVKPTEHAKEILNDIEQLLSTQQI